MRITKEELRKKYEQLTTAELMEYLGIKGPSTLYRILDRAGIARKRPDTAPRVRVSIELVD